MKEQLETISRRIRMALEDHHSLPQVDSVREGFFAGFPHGCCQYTAYIVMVYLNQYEAIPLGDLSLMANANIGKATHAWAKCRGYHIDITGDQLGGPSVWVSQDCPWPDSRPTEHFLSTEPINQSSLRSIEIICAHIHETTGTKRN
jgi:hypothetical protein